jgi:hypothetical protein
MNNKSFIKSSRNYLKREFHRENLTEKIESFWAINNNSERKSFREERRDLYIVNFDDGLKLILEKSESD